MSRLPGFHHSEETKRKMKEVHLRENLKPETIQKMRESRLGKKHSFETLQKMSKSQKGEKSSHWKGDEIESYGGIHTRVKKNKPKSDHCEHCGLITDKLQLANKDHMASSKTPERYNLDPNSYEWLCVRCHMKLDGRIDKLRVVGLGREPSLEHKRKISEALIGIKRSPETIQRDRESKLGSKNPMWGKPSPNPFLGKKHTKIAKQKISDGLKLAYAEGRRQRKFQITFGDALVCQKM